MESTNDQAPPPTPQPIKGGIPPLLIFVVLGLVAAVILALLWKGCIRIPVIGQAPVTATAPAGSTITDSPTGITIKGPDGKSTTYSHRPEAHPRVALPGPGAAPGTPATVITPHSGFALVPAVGVGFDTQASLTIDAGIEFAYLDDLWGLEADVATSTDLKVWRQSLRLNARPFGGNLLLSVGPSGKLGTFSVDGATAAIKVALWD